MIIPGRPVKGYSEIDNFFNNLKLNLKTIETLTNENVASFQERYITTRKRLNKLEDDFAVSVKTISKKYIENGEDGLIAISIAESETSMLYNETYDSLWLKQVNNIRLKEISIDNIVKSTIILLHSTLESGLFELCSILEKEIHPKINISDIKDSKGYIYQSILFLTKVIGINSIEQLYDYYIPYSRLRNIIVHNIQNKEEKIPEQFNKFFHKENQIIQFTDPELITKMLIVIQELIDTMELELDKIQGFPALINKIKNIFWIINQKEITVTCDEKTIIYNCEILSDKYGFKRKLNITFEPSKISSNRIVIDKNDMVINEFGLFQYFNNRLNYLKKEMKYYKKLIKGKKSFKLEIKIY